MTSKIVDAEGILLYKSFTVKKTSINNQNESSSMPRQTSSNSLHQLSNFAVGSSLQKKVVNIPICEVSIDNSYDDYNPPTFAARQSYMKFIRRISEEGDPIVDYIADEEDQEWLSKLRSRPPEEELSIDVFQQVINIFERTSAAIRDLITLLYAIRVVTAKIERCSSHFTQKVLPEIFKYWLSKRERWGKPLVRKFWPPVLAAEMNPFMVFRQHDRERYRLRRQHRRNDLESFRKMQQLRREFMQAKTIMQLMLERESMHEAEFTTNRLIFDEELKNLLPSHTSLTTESTSSAAAVESDKGRDYTYEPQFKHLWLPFSSSVLMDPRAYLDVNSGHDYDRGYTPNHYLDSKEQKNGHFFDHNGSRNGFSHLKSGRLSKASVGSSEDGMSSAIDYIDPKKKRKGGCNRMGMYGLANGNMEAYDVISSTAGTSSRPSFSGGQKSHQKKNLAETGANDPSFLGYTRPSILEFQPQLQYIEDGTKEAKLIHDDLPGPRHVCRPIWPSYFEQPPKKQLHHDSLLMGTPDEYLLALEAVEDNDGLEEDSEEDMRPHKYRIRHRIGRGGRLVMDRIPIRDFNHEEGFYDANDTHLVYPTQLRPASIISSRGQILSSLAGPSQTSPAQSVVSLKTIKSSGGGDGRLSSGQHIHNMGGMNISPATTSYDPSMANGSIDPYKLQLGGNGNSNGPKQLPEVALSNRKVLNQIRRGGRTQVPGYTWSSSTLPGCAYMPPTVPAPSLLALPDRASKLKSILDGNDSENEELVLDGRRLGLFEGYMQQNQEQEMINAAEISSVVATTGETAEPKEQRTKAILNVG